MNNESRRRPLNLYVPGPYEDESISSLCDRVCAQYDIERSSLEFELLRRYGYTDSLFIMRDWDNPGTHILRSLEDALSIEKGTLDKFVIIDGPAWLALNARHVYCPMCFTADIQQGRSPYFRRKWCNVTVTICETHQCPMYLWPSPTGSADVRKLPFSWQVPRAQNPMAMATNAWKTNFYPMGQPEYEFSAICNPKAEALTKRLLESEATLQINIDRYGHPLLTEQRDLKIRGQLITALAVDPSAAPTINPSLGVMKVINGRWFFVNETNYNKGLGPSSSDSWELLRRIASPGSRRAAICMAACTLEPDWPVELFMALAGKVKSGTSQWWHYVIMPYQHEGQFELFDSIRETLKIPQLVPRLYGRRFRKKLDRKQLKAVNTGKRSCH